MGENVVSIRGGVDIKPPGTPEPDVVAEAERVLAMARAGEICSLVTVYSFYDGCVGSRFAGRVGRTVVGEIVMVERRVCASIEQRDSE